MTSVPCEFCNQPVEPDKPGSAQLVHGWVPTRKQGGANAVHVIRRTGLWAHWVCVKDTKNYDPNQMKLI